MKKIYALCFSFSLLFTLTASAQKAAPPARTVLNFGRDWRFHLGDTPTAKEPTFSDADWRKLDVPHDWSIEGEFSEKNPATAGGGALPGGIGWYRKAFSVSASAQGRQVFVDFDGVYRNSEVWINGQYLGKRPSGYASFRYNLTKYLRFDGQLNVIAVRVDNSQQPNSRWYSGSGIYRNVWLTLTQPVFVDHWGTQITTPVAIPQLANVNVKTTIRNASSAPQTVTLNTLFYDAAGKAVGRLVTKQIVPGDSVATLAQTFTIRQPTLWSVDQPYRYKAVSQVLVNNRESDRYETPFGIRSAVFDPQKGFVLNGTPLKIRGVCNHHDLGCLGAAINVRALERQLDILKAMGCNGIRTSHNPPAPELLDLCDRMGFVVMDEAFDMWKKGKSPFDYHLDWDQWHQRDLTDLIRRDRNHPSVIIWSIGNEIPEQGDSTGTAITRELNRVVMLVDSTRPITAACDRVYAGNKIITADSLNLVGINYHHQLFDSLQTMFPGRAYIGTETTSALATRGMYDMPSDSIRRWPIRWDLPFTQGNPDLTCSAYDNCSAPWGSTHEETWKLVKKMPFMSGMFVWTGFDYLGEPTPYTWPARSSYFGIVDMAGFPKDAYYMYQSEWTNTPVLHVFPHWNWTAGRNVDVWVYANSDEVELFLNEKSLGVKRKVGDELHLMWRVPYAPGELRAVSRTNGKDVLTKVVRTAGKPARLVLTPDRKTIDANGDDLSFVSVQVVDEAGVVVPDATNLVQFRLTGNGTLAGVDNGNPISHESFKDTKRKAFNGLCLAVLRAGQQAGITTLTATAPGLTSASVEIISKLARP